MLLTHFSYALHTSQAAGVPNGCDRRLFGTRGKAWIRRRQPPKLTFIGKLHYREKGRRG